MAKTNHFDVEVREIKLSKSDKVLSEKINESYSKVTRNKLQMLIGKFAIEHPESVIFNRENYYVSIEIWNCDEEGVVTILACRAKEVAE